MTESNTSTLQETLALIVSGAIVVAAVVYWIVQIQGVREMLRMAYG